MFFRKWLYAFVFTQIVEVPIYRRAFDCSFLVAFGASAITHPIVWGVFLAKLWHVSFTTNAIVAELFAWLAEAAYFRFIFGYKRALLWSLVANSASLFVGLACSHFFHFP